MARVPVGFALAAAGISVGSFLAGVLGPAPYQPSRLNHVSYVLLWLAVALSIGVARRASTAAGIGQVAAALAAVACLVVALVKLYTASRLSFGMDIGEVFAWIGEAQAMGLAALAFGLAGDRVRTRALNVVFLVVVMAAIASFGYALSISGFRDEGWWAAATVAALLAASTAARMESFRLPSAR